MKKLLALGLIFFPAALVAQTVAINGFCDQGAIAAAVSGLNSTNKMQGDLPQCTVTVYYTGTANLATLYSNPSLTLLSNPFTASTTGQYLFYVSSKNGYDIVLSTGITLTDVPQGLGGTGAPGAGFGWEDTVTATQSSSATTLSLSGVLGVPATGLFFIDGEYESFTAVNHSTNVLSGIIRGLYGTAAATHNPGIPAVSVNLPFGTTPVGGVFGPTPTLAINNGFPTSGYPLVVNSGTNEFDVLPDGSVQQHTSATDYLSPIQIGLPQGHPDGTNYTIPITNTSQVLQDSAPHEIFYPIGDSAGFAGLVSSIPAPNVGAPSLFPVFIGTGTCNITYVVTGVDADGVEVPGTAASVSGLAPWTIPASVTIRYPSAAGVVSYNGYRTAVSAGCTGLALGKFATGITGNNGAISDQYTGGDSTSPPGSNLSVARSCVGTAANHELYCHLSGASSTPPLSCASARYGWDYTNVAATVAPSSYHCYSGASSWTALAF